MYPLVVHTLVDDRGLRVVRLLLVGTIRVGRVPVLGR